jgi:hypothetical protein
MPTQSFKVGEMLNKRTLNSKTWINFDGSYTTEIYNGPVHYEDENGNLQNINTDLFDEADLDTIEFPVAKEGADVFRMMKNAVKNMKKKNILDRDSLDFQGLKVPFDCRIPKNFKRGYVIGKGQNRLHFIPIGVSPTKGFLDENQKNKITYQDPWNDVDVTLEVLPNGIKETIILKSSESPTKFTFEVDGPLEDDLTSGNLKLQPAWLVDTTGERRDVEQTIRREGDKTYVDLVADVTGLAYPIEIDPTVTIQPDGTMGQDTFDGSYLNNQTVNFGSFTQMQIGRESSVGNISRGYIKFDLSTIPSNSNVTSADIVLYKHGNEGTGTRVYDVHRITQTWDENTLTYQTRPSFNPTPTVSKSIDIGFVTPDTITFSVTNDVNAFVNGTYPNYGWVIKLQNESINGYILVKSSEETTVSYRPKLAVTYNIPPTAPTVTSPNGGETWNAQHTITWNAATDPSNLESVKILSTTNGSSTFDSYTIKRGQQLLIDNKFIKQIGLCMDTTGSTQFYMRLCNMDGNGYAGTTVYAQAFKTKTGSGYSYVYLDVNQKLPAGTYVLEVEYVTGSAMSIRAHSGDLYPNKGSYYIGYDGSRGFPSGWDLDVEIIYDNAVQQNELRYHIQLSTNNGQTWKDIVALTSPGATSYNYDFTNEPETSTAKIRIRAYDGTSYGPWDESNGVFTIQHNQAPTVPTNLSPSGGTPKDRASVIRLSWQHNDANGDPQAKFDLQWRLQGSQTWNTVSQVTTNQYWDAPANTFPRGIIEWQIRTYDQAGLSSPYSDIQTFFAGDKPANPTITDPTNGAIVPVANPVVQWSSVGQTAYHVKLLDINNNLLWEVQSNSTNKAQTVLYDLQNNTDYKIQVAIKNADNLGSDFVTSNIHVSYTPPAVPIVATTKGEGIITISIDNPTPTGTEPNVSYNDLYRRKQGESTWTRIATNIPADASFVDYTPASGQVYEYFVRAWGDNGTYSDSLIVTESISFTGVWLHEAENPLETLHQFKRVSAGRSENWQPTAAMMQFAGRRLPVAEYDETEQRSISVKFTILNYSNDREALEKLIRSKNTLCYRDARGRKMFCHAFELPIEDEFFGNTVSLKFEEVSYSEEV